VSLNVLERCGHSNSGPIPTPASDALSCLRKSVEVKERAFFRYVSFLIESSIEILTAQIQDERLVALAKRPRPQHSHRRLGEHAIARNVGG